MFRNIQTLTVWFRNPYRRDGESLIIYFNGDHFDGHNMTQMDVESEVIRLQPNATGYIAKDARGDTVWASDIIREGK
jgi:hypothetical protein